MHLEFTQVDSFLVNNSGLTFFSAKNVHWSFEVEEKTVQNGTMHEKNISVGKKDENYTKKYEDDFLSVKDLCQWNGIKSDEGSVENKESQDGKNNSTPNENTPVGTKPLATRHSDKVNANLHIKTEPVDGEKERFQFEMKESCSMDNVKNDKRKSEHSFNSEKTSNLSTGEMGKQSMLKTSKRQHGQVKQRSRFIANSKGEAYYETCEKEQDCISFAIIFGSCLKIETSRKAILLLLLIVSGLCPASPAAINNDPKSQRLEEYRLLLTSQCNYRDLIRSESCHKNEISRKTYIDFCRFEDLCDNNSQPTCVDGEGGGMLHICSPKNLTCPKGYRRNAWLDNDTDVVHVTEEKCPRGRYQPIESNCYVSCLNKHWDLQDLPEQFALYSVGDNISPTWIYCDFEKGFYNMDGKFLLAYDNHFVHYPFFCTSVSDINPCSNGEYPLPNSTCIGSCMKGLERDAHDGFKCTKSWNGTDVITQSEFSSEKAYQQKTSKTDSSTTGPIENTIPTERGNHKPNDEKGPVTTTLQTFVIAVLIGVVVLIVMVTGLVISFLQHKQNRSKITNQTSFKKTKNKTIIEQAGSVNIYHGPLEMQNGGTLNTSFEMQRFLQGEEEEKDV
ncbi:uncharacterized protein LOC132713251 [Ruditapes philippinarum]|uniref:uncharacterized protein LOC132713251 n=1 Tax=Ruditapes philippinarum TaxID=129788 RepID=UPI00295BFFC2|nr:uncharacterized protein LOC132713251 [Ruditapes philippinarum]